MSNAFAKFCPRLCDVPACSARPSPISASIEYVRERAGELLARRSCGRRPPASPARSRRTPCRAPRIFSVSSSASSLGLVRRVPFLPEELRRAQERPRHLLPADDVRPLVDEDRQIAPRLNPLRVHRADDRFRRRPDDERLLELLVAAVRDPGDLRREAFDVLRLLHQQALGNEQREVRVDVAGRLEPRVERLLDQLPDRVAVRPDDHAALDRRVVGQLRAADDVEVPAAEKSCERGVISVTNERRV